MPKGTFDLLFPYCFAISSSIFKEDGIKKIVSILLVLLVSLSLFADSGYIGIVTGPKVTTGSINNILVMSSDFSTESSGAINQNFNNSHWVLKLRGATFFDENKKNHFGLAYALETGFRMHSNGSIYLNENTGVAPKYTISPSLGFAYMLEFNDMFSLEIQDGLLVQLGFGGNGTYHSVQSYTDVAFGYSPLEALTVKAGLNLGIPMYFGYSRGSTHVLSAATSISFSAYVGCVYSY